MKPLLNEGINYYFTSTKDFEPLASLKESTVLQVFDFAYKMTFANEGRNNGL